MKIHSESLNTSSPFVELINSKGKSPIVLVCEHASNFIPSFLNNLGVSPEDLQSHIAWDIGALNVARKLSKSLDAPLVTSKISRLVYDCNRAPNSETGIPTRSEQTDIPGNTNLSDDQIQERIDFIYKPFHELIKTTLGAKQAQLSNSEAPIVISIHSFTPVYLEKTRSVELGILHDKDDRFAKQLMEEALTHTQLKSEFNSPYGVNDNVMHTINTHAKESGFLNAMIEIKNDLISDESGVNAVSNDLSKIIQECLNKNLVANSL